MARLTLRQIDYLLAVARCGSLRAAAEELDVSQPTLTAQVSRAEEILGTAVLERSRSGARLTPAGRRLEPYLRRVANAREELANAAEALRGGSTGTYRVGINATVGPYLLPRILPRLHERYTDLRLHVREASAPQLEAGLARGDYDLIFTALPINAPELAAESLLREHIPLVLPLDHALAAKDPLAGADLAGTQILTTGPGYLFGRQVEQLCARLGAEVLRDYEGTSLDALRVMVVMGMGLAFLPALYIHSELDEDSGLAVRELADERLARIIALAWRSNAPARNFYRQLAGDLRTLIERELGTVVEVLG